MVAGKVFNSLDLEDSGVLADVQDVYFGVSPDEIPVGGMVAMPDGVAIQARGQRLTSDGSRESQVGCQHVIGGEAQAPAIHAR